MFYLIYAQKEACLFMKCQKNYRIPSLPKQQIFKINIH